MSESMFRDLALSSYVFVNLMKMHELCKVTFLSERARSFVNAVDTIVSEEMKSRMGTV